LPRKSHSSFPFKEDIANTRCSVSNLGGTFPRFFVLKFVDAFTTANCMPPSIPPAKDLLKGDLITQPFSCVLEAEKHRCINGGGSCNIQRDGKPLHHSKAGSTVCADFKTGYYYVNVLCVLIGVVTFVMFIRPQALKLQSLPMRAWRISGGS